jgi:hypothetical protein
MSATSSLAPLSLCAMENVMISPRFNIAFGVILFALALVRPAAAEQMPIPDVTVTPLGGPGTAAYAVNNRGDVAMTAPMPYVIMGFTINLPRAVLWTGGILVDVGAACPTCQYGGLSIPLDVNDERQVIGYGVTANGNRPFSWKDGVWTELASPWPTGIVMPMSVNNAGQIAGYGSDPETGRVRGLLWESATSAPILTSSLLVQDINNRGEMAGTNLVGLCVRAGIETSEGFEDVTAALACPYAVAQAINDARAIAANVRELDEAGSFGPQLAMLFKDGDRHVLTPAGSFATSEASAHGLNEGSDVAGRSYHRTTEPGTCGSQATLWLREGVVALDTPFTDAAGCTSFSATGINIHGQAVGSIAGRAVMWHANIDRFAPTVTQLTAAPVWPPKGNAAPMTFSGRVVDSVHGPSSASGVGSVTYRIIDEYGSYQPSGTLSVTPDGDFSITLPLAQVKGGDHNGRTYVFELEASDRALNTVKSSLTVVVAHGRPR